MLRVNAKRQLMNEKEQRIFLFSKTPYPGVNHIPILQIDYLQPSIDFSSYDYIIATSKESLTALDKIGDWKSIPILAISQSTAKYAQEAGAKLMATAEGYGEDIVTLIKKKYGGLKALYPHAKVVAFDIEEGLKAFDIEVDSFIVYQTSCSDTPIVALPADAVCIFTSPSAVKCFEKSYVFLPSYKVVCIGETTRSALPQGVHAIISENTSVQSTIESAKKLL